MVALDGTWHCLGLQVAKGAWSSIFVVVPLQFHFLAEAILGEVPRICVQKWRKIFRRSERELLCIILQSVSPLLHISFERDEHIHRDTQIACLKI